MQAGDDVVIVVDDQVQLADLVSVLVVLGIDVLCLFRHFLVEQFKVLDLPQ